MPPSACGTGAVFTIVLSSLPCAVFSYLMSVVPQCTAKYLKGSCDQKNRAHEGQRLRNLLVMALQCNFDCLRGEL